MNWTADSDKNLIYLTKKFQSVEELKDYLPDYPAGSIMNRIKYLQRRGKIPRNVKFRMKNWDEDKLIDLALQGLSTIEISKKFSGTSSGTITGRLNTLRAEGKLPHDYIVSQKSDVNRFGKKETTKESNKKSIWKAPPKKKSKLTELESGSASNEPLVNQSQLFFELNERISKLETINTITLPYNDEIDGLKCEISELTANIKDVTQKIHHVAQNEMVTILSKISELNRRLITIEAMIESHQSQLNYQKLMWAAFQKAAENSQSQQIIQILKETEKIISNRK
ncbi:MAG TPA: hypothetical protein PKJ91_00330 [Methanoregulaceae archaeon]|nr:hypothetical protein [Methanoregulaceae archaeon]